MCILHITRQGAEVRLSGQTLAVWKDGERVSVARLPLLETIVLHGAVHVTPAAWARIIAEGIDCALLTSSGRFRARLETLSSSAALRRVRQVQAAADVHTCLLAAKNIARNKLVAQWRVLKAMRLTPLLPPALLIRRLEESVAISEVQGVEGYATRLYFAAARKALPEAMAAWTRRRRPAPDGLNAILGYGYAVLQSRVHAAVGAVGLDPYIGFLHGIGRPRPALVLDMMEEFRPSVVDFTCWRLVQAWGADGWWFSDGGAARLTDEAKRALVTTVENRLGGRTLHSPTNTRPTLERAIELQVRSFARGLEGDWTPYRPIHPIQG